MFEKYLQEIGLSDKEAGVYLALLAVDNDSVVDLSKKTGINRTTIYPVLESLAKKGLISEVKVDKKVRFQAEPPERLITYVERRKILLEETEARLKDIIPQLKGIQRESGELPVVKIYEGRDGVVSSTEDYFTNAKSGETSYALYSKDLLNQVFTMQEQEKFYKIRTRAKEIKSKAIYTWSEKEIPGDTMSDRIKIDGSKYPLFCDIGIIGDRVKITTLGDKVSTILIKNKDIAETLKSFFNYIFDKK